MYRILTLEVFVDNLWYAVVVGLRKEGVSQSPWNDVHRMGQGMRTLRALENICLSLISPASSISQTLSMSASVGSAMAAVRCPVYTRRPELGYHRVFVGKILGAISGLHGFRSGLSSMKAGSF